MRLKQINRPSEKYILDESIKDLYFKMINKAKYLAGRIENQRQKLVVEKEISDFINEYKDLLPTIRTIVVFDKYARQSDPDRPSLLGISKLLNSGDEETRKELNKFKNSVIDKSDKMKRTHEHFVAMTDKLVKSEANGYKGAAFIYELIDLDDTIQQQLNDFYKANVSESVSITEVALEMIEANYSVEEQVNEAKAEPDQYYMIVELALYDENKSDTVPHKNFKNVLVTKAKSQAQARQKLKSSANKSLRELNKKLKDRGLKCKFKKNEWFRECSVYKGYDAMKKKNIKSLSGSDTVSTGVYMLSGMSGHGTIGSVPEHAPNRYAMHSSKSSLTRYLNKQCPMED